MILEEEVCPVCIMPFITGNRINILPCFHKYHSACYQEYVKHGYTLCCLCKEPFILYNDKHNSRIYLYITGCFTFLITTFIGIVIYIKYG